MICTICGAEFEDGAAFCPRCGTRTVRGEEPDDLSTWNSSEVPNMVAPAPPEPQQGFDQLYPGQVQPQQSYGQPYDPPRQAYAPEMPEKRKLPMPAVIALGVLALGLVVFGVLVAVGVISFGGGTRLDSEGNPTASAIIELSGRELADLLVGEGWEWEEETMWLAAPDGGGFLFARGADDSDVDYDELRGLPAFGGDQPVAYAVAVDEADYSSAEHAFASIMTVDSVATEWVNDSRGLAYFQYADGKDGIAFVLHNDYTGRWHVMLFNEAAIEQGVAEYWIGNECGTSVNEIWKSVFGHEPK